METPTFLNSRRYLPAAPPLPRPVHAATLVSAFCLVLMLAAPWIVRYAPATEIGFVPGIADRPAPIRCASAPGYGLPCGGIAVPGAGLPSQHAARDEGPAVV